MSNTLLFLSEMIGTFVLVFGVVATTFATTTKGFAFKGMSKNLFVALGVGISLMLAVYVATAIGSYGGSTNNLNVAVKHGYGNGWVNPAVAFMAFIGGGATQAGAENFGIAVGSEMLGALIAGLLGFTMLRVVAGNFKRNKATLTTAVDHKGNIIGEIFGTAIFLGGVAIAVFGGLPAGFWGLIVGTSVFVALATLGNRFNLLLLNPAAGFGMMIANFVWEGGQDWKSTLITYGETLWANMGTAAAIGAVYYGVSTL